MILRLINPPRTSNCLQTSKALWFHSVDGKHLIFGTLAFFVKLSLHAYSHSLPTVGRQSFNRWWTGYINGQVFSAIYNTYYLNICVQLEKKKIGLLWNNYPNVILQSIKNLLTRQWVSFSYRLQWKVLLQ